MRAELQELLLDQFGNLDAVWTQPDLFKELMSLPLLAMELLLSSDEIQVRLAAQPRLKQGLGVVASCQ